MLDLHHLIDLIIPRGGNELVQHIMRNTRIPVMGHADGICHVYVHAAADPREGEADLSGCQDPVSLGVQRGGDVAGRQGNRGRIPAGNGGDIPAETAWMYVGRSHRTLAGRALTRATEEDWATEYLDMAISVKVVNGVQEAVEHINRYSSNHTDAIVTEDRAAASRFLREVDSASTLHNASTRFADGFRYGLGGGGRHQHQPAAQPGSRRTRGSGDLQVHH